MHLCAVEQLSVGLARVQSLCVCVCLCLRVCACVCAPSVRVHVRVCVHVSERRVLGSGVHIIIMHCMRRVFFVFFFHAHPMTIIMHA